MTLSLLAWEAEGWEAQVWAWQCLNTRLKYDWLRLNPSTIDSIDKDWSLSLLAETARSWLSPQTVTTCQSCKQPFWEWIWDSMADMLSSLGKCAQCCWALNLLIMGIPHSLAPTHLAALIEASCLVCEDIKLPQLLSWAMKGLSTLKCEALYQEWHEGSRIMCLLQLSLGRRERRGRSSEQACKDSLLRPLLSIDYVLFLFWGRPKKPGNRASPSGLSWWHDTHHWTRLAIIAALCDKFALPMFRERVL